METGYFYSLGFFFMRILQIWSILLKSQHSTREKILSWDNTIRYPSDDKAEQQGDKFYKGA